MEPTIEYTNPLLPKTTATQTSWAGSLESAWLYAIAVFAALFFSIKKALSRKSSKGVKFLFWIISLAILSFCFFLYYVGRAFGGGSTLSKTAWFDPNRSILSSKLKAK